MLRLFVFTVGVVTFANKAPAQATVDFERKTVQESGQIVLDAIKAATEAVGGLKDESTAPSVKKALQTAQSLVKQTPWMKDVMRGEETKWVTNVFEPKKREAEFELENARDKLLASNSKLFDAIDDAEKFQKMKSGKIELGQLSAQNLQKACKAYYLLNDEKWPTKLEVLIGADGSRPFIVGGERGIRDPWGNLYKLTIEKDAAGIELPVVSTVTPYDGGKLEVRWPKK